MAQARRKRSRKHRGTQAGTVERPAPAASRGRPSTRSDARKQAAERRAERLDRPPTWRGALNRAALMAAIFGVLVVVAFGREPVQGFALAGLMLVVYIPMSYYTDRFIYGRRQRQKAGGRASRNARGGG